MREERVHQRAVGALAVASQARHLLALVVPLPYEPDGRRLDQLPGWLEADERQLRDLARLSGSAELLAATGMTSTNLATLRRLRELAVALVTMNPRTGIAPTAPDPGEWIRARREVEDELRTVGTIAVTLSGDEGHSG